MPPDTKYQIAILQGNPDMRFRRGYLQLIL